MWDTASQSTNLLYAQKLGGLSSLGPLGYAYATTCCLVAEVSFSCVNFGMHAEENSLIIHYLFEKDKGAVLFHLNKTGHSVV